MFSEKTTRFLNTKIKMPIQKHSPEILLAIGIVGVVTSAVMACKATLKSAPVVEKANEEAKKITDKNDITEDEDSRHEAMSVVIPAVKTVTKNYIPSVVLGTTSIMCILASHNILQKRNVALAAAYTTMFNSFKEYRNGVIEKYGKEVDQALMHQKKENIVVDENGESKVVTDEKNLGYRYLFDDTTSRYWDKNADYNLMFLKSRESTLTDKLRSRGYLYLNDVFEALGMDKTREGQVVGWIYDESENSTSDNYISFGIDAYNENNSEAINDFLDGDERSVWLEFNVDGLILDRFEQFTR